MTFTANVRFKLRILKTENVQLKPVKNNCYGQTQREATNFGVEVMNSKVQVKEKLGHVLQLRFGRLP